MTMNIHFGKHHAAYIKNLGDALKAASVDKTDPIALISDLKAVPEAQRMLIRNNGGGHVNHTWFWKWMAPAGSGPKGPEGKLGEAIQRTFTSIDDFKKVFGEAGTKRFGSGWAWLKRPILAPRSSAWMSGSTPTTSSIKTNAPTTSPRGGTW
jgi:Fe-Mn family superoxide dismutase